ncbi:hypothetical protein SAMN05421810_104195 [Amycolatopsis arida]|uniref:YtxH domain-containing protein n=1 Tax=Amycolatopsis arida TaxID=587909 RepID=A0A1I5V1N6_9PSEU|nr:hypothetical protein [Amycolatopsis arida]TDX91114.1 hypothetical protein CLV69_106194 [Amycolatopsis arida]SFQ01389.1 hypothetical protein SAMN05421810_104195 [Amycolatopsis arida]
MKAFLLGAAVGYVLGARAGRGRYEQIVRHYRTIIDHPAVQGAAGIARAKIGEQLGERVPFGRHTAHGPDGQRRAADTTTRQA